MKQIIVISIMFLFFSCKSEHESIDLEFKEVHDLQLSEILSEIECVPLETNDSCYIGNIKQILYYQERFYVLDFPTGKSVFMFDKNGRYIKKINSVGQGPGEYVLPYNIAINEEENVLYVRDVAQNKMLVYDALNLDFLREYQLNWEAVDFCFDGNKLILYNTLEIIYENEKYSSHILEIDERKKIIDDIIPIEIMTGYILNPNSPFFKTESEVFFSHPYNGKVYKIFNNSFKEELTLVFENKIFPPISFLKVASSKNDFVKIMRESDYINFYTFSTTSSHCCVSFFASDSYYMSVYNKNRNEGIYFSMNNLIDNIGGGSFNITNLVIDDYFYATVNAGNFNENNNNLNIKDLPVLTAESNPVILKFKMSY